MALGWIMLALVASQAGEPAPAQLTKLPVLTRFVDAPYPPAAMKEGREATVVLALDVDARGLVQRVELIESGGADFDEAAKHACAGFVFEPAEAGELGPVPVRITYRYNFKLETVVKTTTVAPSRTATVAEEAAPPAPINFYGTIKESGTRAPVAYASVRVEGGEGFRVTTSTEADAAGRFAVRGVPPGKIRVGVRAPFFQRYQTKERIGEAESLEVLYFVSRAARDPYEVIVRAKVPKREVARRTLTFEEVERLPGTQGDPIRVIQNLPGVARAPFGLGLLVVRGAQPQDSGVFLDGHRLPILFHFGGIGGFTSVVNARMLETIDFLPGGIGPQQGRISAGAVELKSRNAMTDRVHGEAVVDIGGASVFLEGPVTDDPADGAFVIALRRSYVDGVLSGIISALDTSVAIAPRYYDYQLRYDRPAGKDKTITILAYGSDDELIFLGDLGGDDAPVGAESRTYFHRLNPRFTYEPDANTRLSISPIIGYNSQNNATVGGDENNRFRFRLDSWNVGMRVDGRAQVVDGILMRFGGDLAFEEFRTDSELPVAPPTRDFPSPVGEDVPTRRDLVVVPSLIGSLYSEFEINVGDRLWLWPGVRLDVYDFQADPQAFIDPRLVEGRSLLGVDPRLTARYEVVPDRFALKGQIGGYHQPPFPAQFYLNADLPLQFTTQTSVGFEWELVERLTLDVQGYYRYQTNVPDFTGATEVVDGRVRAVGFRPDAKSRSYGTELWLKLEKRRGLFGWIAYTLSRSEFRDDDDPWRPNFFFDQTHNLNIVAAYELGLNWNVSLRFRYITGGGLPKTANIWYDSDADSYRRTIQDELRRAPAFSQLDLRIDKRWTFDEWYLEVYLDVQNVYNHTNTEFFIQSFDFKTDVAIPSLPFFPLLGFKGVF